MKGFSFYCRRCTRRWWQTDKSTVRCPFCSSLRTIAREASDQPPAKDAA